MVCDKLKMHHACYPPPPDSRPGSLKMFTPEPKASLKVYFSKLVSYAGDSFCCPMTFSLRLCHLKGWGMVKVPLCLLLQVGLLKCTFLSGSLVALVGVDSQMGLGLLNGHLLVGLLSGGGGGVDTSFY